jgi:spermidine synthase
MNSATGPQFPIGRIFDRRSSATLAFLTGLCLAVVQVSHFFLLEARLSSTAFACFTALFFWLAGFLVGLNMISAARFSRILILSVGTYYCAFLLARTFPHHMVILPVLVLCVGASGVAAGAFFPYARGRFHKVKDLLFHENNGFVIGLLAALLCSVHAGGILLMLGPAVSLLPVIGSLEYQRRRSEHGVAVRAGELAAGCTPSGLSAFPLLASGIYFGVMQVAIYFAVQVLITASHVGYFVVLLSWLTGAIIGLKVSRIGSLAWSMALSLGAWYALLLLAPAAATANWLVPILAVLVVVSGLPAGRFFREFGRSVRGSSLFFHENNGFVLGYLLAVFGFMHAGQDLLWLGTLVCFGIAWLSQTGLSFLGFALLSTAAFLSLLFGSPALSWTLMAAVAFGGVSLFSKPGHPRAGEESEDRSVQDIPARLLKPLLFLAGVNLVLLQYLMTREFLAVLTEGEFGIVIAAAVYFTGFSVGYGACRFVSTRLLRILAPVIFVLHLLLLPVVKVLAAYLISRGLGVPALIGLLFFTAVGTSAFYALLLPRFVERQGARSLASSYAWDLAGVAVGTISLFLLIPYAPAFLLPVYFVILLLMSVLLVWRTGWAAPVGLAGSAAVFVFVLVQGNLECGTREDCYRLRNYPNARLIASGDSFHHSVDVIETYGDEAQRQPLSRVSFINGVPYFAYDHDFHGELSRETELSESSHFMARVPARFASEGRKGKLNILVLGCGAMHPLSLVRRWSAKTTIVEIDPLIVETARKCWAGVNRYDEIDDHEVVIDDPAHYLRRTEERFDVIVNDISTPLRLRTTLLHSREFYELAASRLAPGGLFVESTHGSPRVAGADGHELKILAGMHAVFGECLLLETTGRTTRGRNGYIYASRAPLPSRGLLRDQLEKDGLLTGIEIHERACAHYELDRSSTAACGA